MTESNNHSFADSQNGKIIEFLTSEIACLKLQLMKKDHRISSLDALLNQIMENHNAEVRAYEDLKDKLEDVIEMLRKKVSHGAILDYLRVKDSRKLG
jgi:predicted RNase H-like nuclease (RuvC/YqgF family)